MTSEKIRTFKIGDVIRHSDEKKVFSIGIITDISSNVNHCRLYDDRLTIFVLASNSGTYLFGNVVIWYSTYYISHSLKEDKYALRLKELRRVSRDLSHAFVEES